MSTILEALASTYSDSNPPTIGFVSIDAEELPEISEKYDVTAVPYIVLQKDGKALDTISGSDASKVRAAVEKHAGKSENPGKLGLPPAQQVTKPAGEAPVPEDGASNIKDLSSYAPSANEPATAPEYSSSLPSKEELHKRLSELVKAAPVMLFMKGTPSAPQCGFSRQTVALLRERSIRYGFFNILADDEVRQGLKEFSDWPTFPQLYADGELVGGLDIVSLVLGFLIYSLVDSDSRLKKNLKITQISSRNMQSKKQPRQQLRERHDKTNTNRSLRISGEGFSIMFRHLNCAIKVAGGVRLE